MSEDMERQYTYALFHEPTKSYVLDTGYYGNEVGIFCLESKEKVESHIATYYPRQGYKAKRLRLKQS